MKSLALLPAILAVNVASYETSLEDRCSAACNAVSALYPRELSIQTSPAYAAAQQSYWSEQQRQAVPACFFQPLTAEQVQRAVVEVKKAGCPFSIKGGGHSYNSRGSSIDGGFQFNLVNLGHMEISENRKTLKVGPGLRWGPVVKYLEGEGLMAVAGRDVGVGVPGLTFGGGISNLASVRGWSLDNLKSVDLVLADGGQVTASASSHQELFKAVRGGGGHNFGIATSLTIQVYAYDGMWGGLRIHSKEYFDDLWDAYDTYMQKLPEDGKAHLYVDFARRNGSLLGVTFMAYPEPVVSPDVFSPFRAVPAVFDSLRLANYSGLAEEETEITSSRGRRNSGWTHAIEYDIDLIKLILDFWTDTTESISKEIDAGLDFNIITPGMRNSAAQAGNGNVLGLEGPDEPLINILFTMAWDDKSLDAKVLETYHKLSKGLKALAGDKNHRYIYANYANLEQDVISSYGKANKRFLKSISAKYDPSAFFQKFQPGGFKL
ncbi:hypothetical protein HJFPF1_10636 [Paramyrothecium foliicola]|nr:hypothetical protein HJFPF1_10636 [Paramyrothecium foliicola]